MVFDLDDTLYLERHYVRSGFQAVGAWASRWLGIPDYYERAWRLFLAGERGHIFDHVLAMTGSQPSDTLIKQLVSVYRSHYPAIALQKDAAECLTRLNGHANVALLTDGPAISQGMKVKALGLGSVADPLIFTDGWGREYAKPDTRCFQFLERCCAPISGRFVYVGDNPQKDFAAPKSLGWRTVRVRRKEGVYSSLPNRPDCEPDEDIHDLHKLPQIARS